MWETFIAIFLLLFIVLLFVSNLKGYKINKKELVIKKHFRKERLENLKRIDSN